jgi:beta-1,4-mannosyl-glycoprotein beta-1,4-N-acetylglucosaminyltransferase
MIYDCFLFNNELDVLEIRLHELNPVVDRFVLVESTLTHVNRPKPLYFQKNQYRFKEFTRKIIHVVVKDTPNVSLAWIINDYQFSQMVRGLKNCRENDIILFGDVDEIPKASKVLEWKEKEGRHKLFLQRLSYYYLMRNYRKTVKWYAYD